MNMKHRVSVRKLVAASLLAVALGFAGAAELSLTFCRDVLYQPAEDDSLAQPVAALLGVGFRLGATAALEIRAGYSGYANQALAFDSPEDERLSLHGARLQIAPMLKVPTPLPWAAVLAGVGLAGNYSLLRRGHWGGFYTDDRRDVSTTAFDQSFLLGATFELSRRLGVNIEAERVGFAASYTVERNYKWYEYWSEPIELSRYDDLEVGWHASAPTGIGVGLKVKL